MTGWGADMVGMSSLQDSIDKKSGDAVIATTQGGREHAEELLRKIKATAPVGETGEYRDDWRIEENRGADDETHIVNSTDHGPYLVFPNQKMVGSPKADRPGVGIVHNVRGLVFAEQKGYRQSIIQSLKRILFK